MHVNFLYINFDNNKPNDIYLFMETNQEEYTLIAQVISLDVRGNYSEVLNGITQVRKFPQTNYEWAGNCFRININNETVKVYDLYYEENDEQVTNEEDMQSCEINLREFEEVVNGWKKEYLQTMGFSKFESKALSHLYGVLLLVYDKVDENNPSLSDEQIRYSIWQAARRYDRAMTTLYHQCKHVLSLNKMHEFYDWCRQVFVNKDYLLLKDIEDKFLEILQ